MKKWSFLIIELFVLFANADEEITISNTSYYIKGQNKSTSNCQSAINSDYFNFQQMTDPITVSFDLSMEQIVFSLCGPVYPIPSQCDQSANYSAYLISLDEACIPLTQKIETKMLSANTELTEMYANLTVNPDNSTTAQSAGLELFYNNSNILNDTLKIFIICDPNADNFTLISVYESDLDDYVIEGYSSAGCYLYSGNQIFYFIEQNKIIFIIIGIVIGLIVCFLGLKVFKATIFVFAFLITAFPIFALLFTYCLPEEPSKFYYYLFSIISIIVGIAAGVLFIKIEKYGVVLCGGIFGFFISLFLQPLVLAYIQTGYPQLVAFGTIAVLVLIGFLVGWFLHDDIVILASSFVGAYGAIRGVSGIFGGFPNEFEMAKKIESGELQFSFIVYIYLVAILILAAIGIVFQYYCRTLSFFSSGSSEYIEMKNIKKKQCINQLVVCCLNKLFQDQYYKYYDQIFDDQILFFVFLKQYKTDIQLNFFFVVDSKPTYEPNQALLSENW